MKIIQTDGGYTREELQNYRELIYENALSQMQLVANNAMIVGISNAKTKVKISLLYSFLN
jgi:hypothetical protein